MEKKAKHATHIYLLVVVVCIAIIIGCLRALRSIIYAPVLTLVLSILLFASLLMIFVMGLVVHVMRGEARDWRATCEPLIANYEATGDVDAFVGGYEDWRLGQHTSALRYEFLERVCELLVRDGHGADAQVALSGLSNMAETRHAMRRYQAFRAQCLSTLSDEADWSVAARPAEEVEPELEPEAPAGYAAPAADIDEPDEGFEDAPVAEPVEEDEPAQVQAENEPEPAESAKPAEEEAEEEPAPQSAHMAAAGTQPRQRAPHPEVESTIDLLRSAGVKPGAWDTSYQESDRTDK